MQETPQSHPSAGQVTVRATLPAGTRVDILVETFDLPEAEQQAAPQPVPVVAVRKSPTRWKMPAIPLEGLLFALALGIYLLVHFVGLNRFPIYFFTDEAIQAVHADSWLSSGLRGGQEYLPTFFINGGQYNLGVSVYLQVLASLLFEQTIWVTRGASVLVSLLAAVCVGLTLKNIFGVRHYWIATLLLTLTPAWFLHSRTAFETVLAVSFYTAFLYFYLMYRSHSPRNLYAAIIFAALAFYSYSPAQLVVGVTALLLFISDLGFHWQQRKFILRGFALILLCFVPYLRFLDLHPNENVRHLQILNSYWIQSMPLLQKLGIYFKEYLRGLNPFYWYTPNQMDLVRHLMKDYGHVLGITLPLLILGILAALRKIRQSEHRAVLIALLAAPSGAALAQIGITRALFMVIPLCLLSGLGLAVLINFLARSKVKQVASALLLFAVMAAGSLAMLRDALRNGPTWYSDYGLTGMQYGGQQLFDAVNDFARAHPQDKLIVSPVWANGTDVIADYFSDDPMLFEMGSVRGYMLERRPLDERTVFVVTPEEYQEVLQEEKFTGLTVLQTLPYPNGQPGFYFIQIQYNDNADALFSAEAKQRRALQETELKIDGQNVHVQYALLDMGEIQHMFDADLNTLTRTYEANPLRVILTFPEPRQLEEVSAQVGGTSTRLSVTLYPSDGGAEQLYTAEVLESTAPRMVPVAFNALLVEKVQIEILSVNDAEPAHVHCWEILLK